VIYAADLNPGAVQLMVRNIALNKVRNVVPILADAKRLPGILPRGFDRIVMNLPFGAMDFLVGGLSLCRPQGTIHLYAMVGEEGALAPVIRKKGLEITGERVVHSYSPKEWLAVYDLMVR